MPKPYPREFREDVIRVARGREPDVLLKDIAAGFGSRSRVWRTGSARPIAMTGSGRADHCGQRRAG
jgi:hypothetical protein